jgi:uncharacterized protein YjbI with pentapeptide repeats
MAEETHVAALKQGVPAWNEWRAAHPDTRPNLFGANLRGLDLANADLAGGDLQEADLRGAVLREAILVGANLAAANLFKAVLDGADLSGANVSGARFLNCAQLLATRNWQSTFRDSDLACGAAIPPIAGRL